MTSVRDFGKQSAAVVKEWLDEQEGFALRRERMGEDLPHGVALPWLEAACGRGLAARGAEVAALTGERDAAYAREEAAAEYAIACSDDRDMAEKSLRDALNYIDQGRVEMARNVINLGLGKIGEAQARIAEVGNVLSLDRGKGRK